LRRFFIEDIGEKDGYCLITKGEATHMTKVLRMEKGDRLILMDGRGDRFEAEIKSTAHREVRVRLIRSLPKPAPPPVEINLYQALLKSKAMDYLIEKTSELGVSRVIPFYSDRTVIKLDEKRILNKERHWSEIAKSVSKQSGRLTPSTISRPISFQDLISKGKIEEGLKVVLWEQEDSKDFKEVLRLYAAQSSFMGIIGPEGGFTNKEIEELRDSGFITVTLGERILRAETAAITLVALVQYEWGDLGVQRGQKTKDR
jgi:16S rRNA (uracil1498-N3)-methyltransferase